MRRKLNAKLLLIILAGIALLGVGVHFLHGFQVERNAGNLLDQARDAETLAKNAEELAKKAETEGKDAEKEAQEAAKVEQLVKEADLLHRYLTYRPNEPKPLARYGLALAQLLTDPRSLPRAFLALERALLVDAENNEVRRVTVDVGMKLERFSESIEHLTVLRKATPTDGELAWLQAQCHAASGDYKTAETHFRTAIELAPKRTEGYLGLAAVLRQHLNNAAKADELIDKMASIVDTAPAHLQRAFYLKQFATLDKAEAALARAREIDAKDQAVVWASAEFARTKGDLNQARTYLKQGLLDHPKDRRFYDSLATVELQDGKRKEAIACLQSGVKALPKDGELSWFLADLLIEDAQVAEAKELIDKIRKGNFPAPLVKYLDARLEMANRQWSDAATKLQGLNGQFSKWPRIAIAADLSLAVCYEQLGDPDRRYAVCRRVLDREPKSVQAGLGMAAALAAMGKADQALEMFRQLAPTSWGAKVATARLLLHRNLGLPKDQQQWSEIEKLLKEASQEKPEPVEVTIARAEVLAAKDQLVEAGEVLTTARDARKDQPALWIALAALAERNGKPDQALALLNEAEQNLNDRVELRLAKAAYWVRRGGDEARAAIAVLADNASDLSDLDQQRLWRGLAVAQSLVGDATKSANTWRKVAEKQPDAVDVRFVLFDLALRSNDTEAKQAIEKELGELERLQGADGVLWRFARASYLVWLVTQKKDETASLSEARALLNGVALQRPAWVRVPLLESVIEELSKNQTRATAAYQRAVALGERNPEVIRRLVQLLQAQGRFAEAEQVLLKLPEESLAQGDMQRLASSVFVQTNKFDRALALAQKAVKDDAKNFENHVWLGAVLEKAARSKQDVKLAAVQLAEAEEAFRKGVELAGEKSEARIALVYFLVRAGLKEKAEAAVEEAKDKLPADQKALALAQCYLALDRKDQAKEQFLAALAAKPNDLICLRSLADFYLRSGQPNEAETYLWKIIELQGKSPEEASAAKQMLALVLAGRGDYQRQQKALEVLGLQDASGLVSPSATESLANLRVNAVVLAMQKGRKERRAAIKLLEGFTARQPLSPADQSLLAQLYESVGDWPRARDTMISLLAAHGDEPAFQAQYARSLIRRNDADGAAVWVARLEKKEPSSFRTADLKARLLKAQGKDRDAAEVLKKYSQGKDANVGLAALVLDNLKLPEAEDLYRKFVAESKKPEAVLVLAEYLGRRDQSAEALDLCDRAWKTCLPVMVASSYLEILYAAKDGTRFVSRVEPRLQEAMKKNPREAAFLQQLAALRNLQSQFDEAEKLFRQAHALDAQNPVVLNNLVWLLAMQQGKTTEALNLINQAINKAGPLSTLLDTRGTVYLKTNQPGLALADFEEAVIEEPSAANYFHLTQGRLAAGDRRLAKESWAKAIEAGLEASTLHPLERPDYQTVLKELGPK